MRAISSGFVFLGVTLGVTVLLAGCSSMTAQTPASTAAPPAPAPIGKSTAPVGDVCSAQGAQSVVGKMPTMRVVEDARVRSGARMARVVRQGQAVTQDFDRQRLNLELDGSGKIAAVRCG